MNSHTICWSTASKPTVYSLLKERKMINASVILLAIYFYPMHSIPPLVDQLLRIVRDRGDGSSKESVCNA